MASGSQRSAQRSGRWGCLVALVLLVALAAVPLGVWLVVIVPDSRMVMVPVVLVDLLGWVLVIGWRVSFPRRATRTLVALGAGKDGDRPRLRRSGAAARYGTWPGGCHRGSR
jgi:hypothetical protein